LIACPQSAGQMDMGGVLQALGQQGMTRIFCEGGAALSASLLLHDLVDEIVGFTAGLVLGAEGWPALGAMGYDRLADAARFNLYDTKSVGGDVLHRWRRSSPERGVAGPESL